MNKTHAVRQAVCWLSKTALRAEGLGVRYGGIASITTTINTILSTIITMIIIISTICLGVLALMQFRDGSCAAVCLRLDIGTIDCRRRLSGMKPFSVELSLEIHKF